jgi:TolB-like protein/DNA-binding winged helix-turn-helix (wHTH) protein/Flp pilus assembly protein TadD
VLRIVRFGDYQADLHTGELRKNGRKIRLSGQPFRILTFLLEKPGELITREELRSRLWPDEVFVDFDHSLNAAVNKLREALCDSTTEARFIETLPKRGYRFVGSIEAGDEPAVHQTAVIPSTAINKLRDALGDSADNPRFIETLPRRGYRFIAPVIGDQQEKSPVPEEESNVGDEQTGKNTRISRWLAPTAVAVLVLLTLAYVIIRRSVSPGRAPVIRSLAVLPLENLSGDASQEYFADGMTDALITDLAQIGELRVISRTSVMRYKGSRKSLPEIARELSVDGIVEGTIMRSGDHVRITSQLIYAPADQHLWARSYERDLSNVLTLQGEVARAIAEEVRVAVTPEEGARLTVRSAVIPDAYEANLKGRYFWNKRTADGSLKAMEYFQQAIDKDQAYAPPYVGLADSYTMLANWGLLAPREAMPKAKAAALKAVELDDRLAEAHVSLGMVRLVYEWDWPAAGKDFERAIVLNPASPAAHLWYSKYLMILRRSDEALTEAKRAVGLDPVSPDVNHQVAWLLNVAGRYDEAIEWERRTLDMDPGFPPAHSVLASAYEGKGMHDEAVVEAKRLLALSPDATDALGSLGYTHARSGERSQAHRELAELGALSKHKYVPSIDFATVYLGLGDKEQAFRWLEKACEERSGYLPWLTVHTKWAPLRADPQYSDLLRCMGLPE